MRYQLTPIHCRPWTLSYLSIKLIESHYENDYGSALRRLNAITEQLEKLDWANTPSYVINGLKRDELAALNSKLLHELYFASMGGNGQPTEEMSAVLARDFGSVLQWKDEFVAMGNALAGGAGWVVLVYLPSDRRLVNQYATEHSQAVAGGVPILALDMYEHAYHMDYGANARAYVDTFMRNIDWKALYARYEDAAKVGGLRALEQNAITEKLKSLDWVNTPGYVINVLKHEELVALNSTLLHELYFASMGGDGQPTEAMSAALARDFGSVLRWKDEFVAMGNALAGGSGWVVLTYIPRDRRLVNQHASESGQAVAGGIPILALDMYEHAYHMEYGANAKAYVDTFMRNVDWKALYTRYEDAAKVGGLRALEQNAITEKLKSLDWANTPGYVINVLKHEELVALNSTLLHELYFASMGGDGQPTEAMSAVLARDFGSVLRWKDEFVAMGNALAGGSGWVVLTYIPRDRRLVNQHASEPSQAVAGGIPILALDMYEHAYHMEYGANAKAYVDTFMRNVDWKALYTRYEDAAKVGGLRALEQNAITEKLKSLDWVNTPGYVINVLKHEELVALNSTLLHELYFASMGGDGQPTEAMSAVLARDFGSVLRWKDEFVAMGNALAGGSGWVVLTYIPRDRRLVNQHVSEPSQAVSGGIPILALD